MEINSNNLINKDILNSKKFDNIDTKDIKDEAKLREISNDFESFFIKFANVCFVSFFDFDILFDYLSYLITQVSLVQYNSGSALSVILSNFSKPCLIVLIFSSYSFLDIFSYGICG